MLTLDPTLAAHFDAVNSFDVDAILDTFAHDALVNDAAREFCGHDRIRAWIMKEMVGDHVTIEPLEVVDHDGLYAVRGKFDGDYDKTNLPDPLIMTNYFRLRAGKIVTLFIVKNSDPQY